MAVNRVVHDYPFSNTLRNAMGAVKAYTADLLASMGDPASQKVGFDAAVDAMRETGRNMSGKYKETSQGGLALSFVNC